MMTVKIPRRAMLCSLGGLCAIGLATPSALAAINPGTQDPMYAAALTLLRRHVRGGREEPVFKAPYLDAAFSQNIYLWDTCFMAAFAKYHQDELPIHAALDNFYRLQDADGWMCREYTATGQPFWPKAHPVSINPPLLAFAELELQSERDNLGRLRRVYPNLRAHYHYLQNTYRMDDGLYFNDAFGSGMDNIQRFPLGWEDDGRGIALENLYPEVYRYDGLSTRWNRQGRMVDISAQMALFANHLGEIAIRIGATNHVAEYHDDHAAIAAALNARCWHDGDGCYYDLGYGQPIIRRHIGMFWPLWAGIVPAHRQPRLLAHLLDPAQFWRQVPLASTPADDPAFDPAGGYWRGSVWAPTNLMAIRGLENIGRADLARKLALQYYGAVRDVFDQTGTFWENYAPDHRAPGNQAQPDFCGWTAIAPIALYREYVQR